MSLLPNAGPPLAMTHQPISPAEMMRLALALRSALNGEPVSVELVERIAAAEDAPAAHVYAAMAMDPNMAPQIEHDVLVAICVGSCQAQGAIPILQTLLEERAARVSDNRPAFDILPRSCLDLCPHSPVCMTRTPTDLKAHARLTPEKVRALLPEILGES